jgi:hypothetical protein
MAHTATALFIRVRGRVFWFLHALLSPYRSPPSFSLTLRLASTSAASAAACALSSLSLRGAYSGSVSQWVASAFKAASSLTDAERSRAMSLLTSLGSWGPAYEPNILRHQLERGFSRPDRTCPFESGGALSSS